MKRWGLFLGLSAFLAVAWFCLPLLSLIPDLCMFKRLMGTGCPGCGLTRSVAATVHLNLWDAIQFHLFGPMIVAGVVVVWGCLLFGVRIPWEERWATRVMGAAIIGLLVYYGIRLSMGMVP